MENYYITFDNAKKFKRLGMNIDTNAFYTKEGDMYRSYNPDYWNDPIWGEYCAPTIYEAAKWLREEMGCDIVVRPKFNSETGDRIGYFWKRPQRTDVNMNPKTFDIYEDALSDAITNYVDSITDSINEIENNENM